MERGSRVSAATRKYGKKEWKVTDLTDFSVDAWEPSLDNDLWRNKKRLNIYVQTTSQGDGERVTNAEPKPVYVLEVK